MSKKKGFKKSYLYRFLLAVLVILVGFLILSAVKSKKESYSKKLEINISNKIAGKSMLLAEDIEKIIHRSFGYDLVGVSLSDIEILEVENMLKHVPLIKEANVYIDANNNVNIEVEQREPVVRIIDKNGNNYYLDNLGVRIPVSNNFSPRVIVANGSIPEFNDIEFKKGKGILAEIFTLAKLLTNDEFYKAQIEQIYLTSKEEIVLVPKVGDHKILFGAFSNAEEKLENLKIFYRDGMPYKGWNTYKEIDLRYDGQVVGKKRNTNKS